MIRAILRSLEIKKKYIEEDEFDRGSRNIFNYGHSFGHAIEAATDFAIPHGIAVTIGMDMANYVSQSLHVGKREFFDRMHVTLRQNYRNYEVIPVPLDRFLRAILKDKKNTSSESLTLILPDSSDVVSKTVVPNDQLFRDTCETFLTTIRSS